MSDLEEALTLRPTDGGWMAFSDPRYEALNAMFGGWTAAVTLGATLKSANNGTRPSAMTINFVDRVEPGIKLHLRTRSVGGSRSVQHYVTEMSRADDARTLAVATVVLTNRRDTDGHTQPSMPDAPDPELLEEFHPPGREGERVMVRPITGAGPGKRASTTSTAWVREMTGRRVDHLQLAFLADQFEPRSFFWSEGPRPSATLCLSVYFLCTDEELEGVGDDYVLSEATGSRGVRSTSAQQARIWSRSGVLLATSEQLCWYR